MAPVVSLIALLAALAVPIAQAVVPAGTVAYADLAPFRRQFDISIDLAFKENGVVGPFTRHTCINATTFGVPCNQPPISQLNTVIRFNWAQKNTSAPLRLFKNATAEEIQAKLCYQTISWTDRPWRKKNKAYPKYGMNCHITVGKVAFAPNGSMEYELRETETPTALWHLMFQIRGHFYNGTGPFDYVQFESTENTNTVETVKVDGVTDDMIIAASILSGFCPIFYFLFLTADFFYWKKTGNGIKVIKTK